MEIVPSHAAHNFSSPGHIEQNRSFLTRIRHLFTKNGERIVAVQQTGPIMPFFRLNVAQRTDVGRQRQHNEDNVAYIIPKDGAILATKGALLLVADGMGGHAAGEVASEMAVSNVSTLYYHDLENDVPTSLLYAIKQANAIIYQTAMEDIEHNGMGTTCVAAVILGNVAYIANVGDSRAYLIRKGEVRQISQDHSWVAEQVRAGALTEEEARMHDMRNMITRSLGSMPDVDVDIFVEQLEEGDALLLCSDGLSGMVSNMEILQIVERYPPQECVHRLVDRANAQGGTDNVTALVARVFRRRH